MCWVFYVHFFYPDPIKLWALYINALCINALGDEKPKVLKS